jgi:hypothetical protein
MTKTEEALLSRSFISNVEVVQPQSGSYQVTPIIVGGDYVAITPIASQKSNSIIIPDAETTIGIVVGLGPLVDDAISSVFVVGSMVKFVPKQVICDLSGIYPFYGKSQVLLIRYNNILAKVPGDSVVVVGADAK